MQYQTSRVRHGIQVRSDSASGFVFTPHFVSGFVGICDALVSFMTGMMIYALYVPSTEDKFSIYLTAVTSECVLLVTAFYFSGLYSLQIIKQPAKQWGKIWIASLVVFLSLLCVAFFLKVSDHYSRVWALSWWTSSTLLICLLRAAMCQLIHSWAETGRMTRNIVLVCAGEQAYRLCEALKFGNEPWNVIVGIFDDRSTRRHEGFSREAVSGPVKAVREFIRRNRVDEVILALPWHSEKRVLEILEYLHDLPVKICLAPDLLGFRFQGDRLTKVGEVWLLDAVTRPITGWSYVFKVSEDRVVSSVVLVVTAPLWLAIALFIKIDSRGPVLFRQKRYGFNREIIYVYKFRTMYSDQTDHSAISLTKPDDKRVTRLGRYLRRYSLDELPQLINVLKGEMSLIGPRPHALEARAGGELYEDAVAKYAIRHKVKPGISGWAQVNGWRGDTDTVDKLRGRVEHDLYYIENWSPLLDLKILFKTLSVVFKGTNAY